MSRSRIQIIPHLNYSELTQLYQECVDSKRKNYWLAIRLLSHPDIPMTVEQVAEIIGFSTDWVRKLAGRYNRLGPEGLMEVRQSSYATEGGENIKHYGMLSAITQV